MARRAGNDSLRDALDDLMRRVERFAEDLSGAVDDARVRSRLLHEYGIEIGAGLGPFKGRAWRIGLMGHSSSQRNVTLLLAALETILSDEGIAIDGGAALSAAAEQRR